MNRRATTWPDGGWLDAFDRRGKAHPLAIDILFALALAVTVADDGGTDGPGGVASVPGAGSGLRGLRDRVGAVGGTFTAGPAESGFEVRAAFPRRRGGRTGGES